MSAAGGHKGPPRGEPHGAPGQGLAQALWSEGGRRPSRRLSGGPYEADTLLH